MIILLRKWDGLYPSWNESRSTVWLGASSLNLTAWVLSSSKLTWGYRESRGYLGGWNLQDETTTYHWHCWTSELFARMAYKDNSTVINEEKKACYKLTKELGFNIIDINADISLSKDPAGLTVEEFAEIIKQKTGKGKV